MLGQPVYFLTPDVVGVNLTGGLQRRRHRDRPRAHRHRDAAQGEGRRQVRRVLRRGRGVAARCPTARPSPTWRPSTARRWASSRSTRQTIDYLRATGRTDEEIDALRGLLQGAGHVRHPAARARSTTPRSSSSTSRRSSRRWPARSARRTASSWARSSDVHAALQPARGENGFAQSRRLASGSRRRVASPREHRRRPIGRQRSDHATSRDGPNRPTPSGVAPKGGTTRSATATCSSPRSRRAPTRRIPA